MLITPSTLETMFFGFDARFSAGYGDATPWSSAIATTIPSNTKSHRYHWLELIPRMREWVGERLVRNLSAKAYTIENKSWELTLEVDKEDVEDDQLGVANDRAEMMGRQAKKWPDDVITDLIIAGTTTLGPDGQCAFDTDHPISLDNSGLGSYSNSLSLALTAANYGAARAAMKARKGADGKSLGVAPTLLMVPPSLEDTGTAILTADVIAPSAAWAGNAASVATNNIYKGTAKLLVVPELEVDPTRWYLFDTSKPVKPIVWQLRKAPEFHALTNPTDDNVFWHRKFVYGVDSRGNAGFTMPFLMLTSKP